MQFKSIGTDAKRSPAPQPAHRAGRFPSQSRAPAQGQSLAPMVRVSNFRKLSALVGEDKIGAALGVSVQRLQELLEGLNFSEETAYHIEITLALPSGYFDQVNPRLSEREVQRIMQQQLAEYDDEPSAATSVGPKVVGTALPVATNVATAPTATPIGAPTEAPSATPVATPVWTPEVMTPTRAEPAPLADSAKAPAFAGAERPSASASQGSQGSLPTKYPAPPKLNLVAVFSGEVAQPSAEPKAGDTAPQKMPTRSLASVTLEPSAAAQGASGVAVAPLIADNPVVSTQAAAPTRKVLKAKMMKKATSSWASSPSAVEELAQQTSFSKGGAGLSLHLAPASVPVTRKSRTLTPSSAQASASLPYGQPLPTSRTTPSMNTATTANTETSNLVLKLPRGVVTEEELERRQVRTANLVMLTEGPGFKKMLGTLTGLSAANISHRLHGNKIFDKATADFFCERLNLPLEWFETPQSSETVPAITIALLNGTARPPSQVVAAVTPAPNPAQPVAVQTQKGPDHKVETAVAGGSSEVATPVPAHAASASPSAAAPALTVPAKKVGANPTAKPTVKQAVLPAAETTAVVAQVAAPVASVATLAPLSPATPAQRPIEALLNAPALEASPIAEALLKTMLKKVREGRLPEDKALSLLVEVMAL